jgi:hypothetical protein
VSPPWISTEPFVALDESTLPTSQRFHSHPAQGVDGFLSGKQICHCSDLGRASEASLCPWSAPYGTGHQLEHPEMSRVEDQHAPLQGSETREDPGEKWERTWTSCDVKHTSAAGRAHPGQSQCGERSGAGMCLWPDCKHRRPEAALTDAAVTTTCWVWSEQLSALGMPIACGSAGLTPFNRTQRGLPKKQSIDAPCVGKSTLDVLRSDKGQGLPNRDMVKAMLTSGPKQGIFGGRALVRAYLRDGWSRASAIASAHRFIAVMALAPHPPEKEHAILARFW